MLGVCIRVCVFKCDSVFIDECMSRDIVVMHVRVCVYVPSMQMNIRIAMEAPGTLH